MQLDRVDSAGLLANESTSRRMDTALSFHSCFDEHETRSALRRRTLKVGGFGTKSSVAILFGLALIVAILWVYYHPLWDFIEQINPIKDPEVRSQWLIFLREYASIPVVAAIVGWGTNAVAISMTFYPLEFAGCLPSVQVSGMPIFGWQGIIPANVRRMASKAVDLATTQLFNADEAMGRLDVHRLAKELRPVLESLTPKIIETIAVEYAPRTWEQLPESVKKELVTKCVEKSSVAISGMMGGTQSLTSNEEGPNLQEVLVDLLVRDKSLVNDIFLKVAGKEYEFIRVSGAYLGFIFGIFQAYLWFKNQVWWVLPTAGFLVGYLTNFVALKCIFKPIEPKYICGIKFHGLFLKRQGEVAVVYSDLFSSRVLNANNIILGMIKSEKSDVLFDALDQSVKDGIDAMAKQVVLSRRLANRLIGPNQYSGIKARVSELIKEDILSGSFLPHVTPYLDELMDVRATLEKSMNDMTCEQFAGMLLPAFEEGEFKLIVIGGVLGAAVGMLQALVQVPEQLGVHWF